MRSLDRHRVHVAEHRSGRSTGRRRRPRAGFDEEPKPGRSMAWTVWSGVSAATVSKKEVLFEPRPCRQTTCSGPVRRRSGRDRRAADVSTSVDPQQRRPARRAAGRAPRSRAPGRGCRARRGGAAAKASSPDSRPSRSASQVAGVGADHHVGLAHRGRPDLAALARAPAPPRSGRRRRGGSGRWRRSRARRPGSGPGARRTLPRTRRTPLLVQRDGAPCTGGERYRPTRPPEAPPAPHPANSMNNAGGISATISIREPMAREVRIRDTLSGELRAARAARAGQGRHLRLRPDRLLADPRRQRAPVRGLHAAAAASSSASGYEPTAGHQRHRHQRQDLRRGARGRACPRTSFAAEMTRAYVEDTDRLGLGRPDAEPLATRDDPRDRRPDRGPDRARPRLRVGRRRLLPGPQLPRLRQALEPRPRRDGPGRGGRHASR